MYRAGVSERASAVKSYHTGEFCLLMQTSEEPLSLTSASLPRTALARPSSCAGASSPLPQAALREAVPPLACRLLETLAGTYMTQPSLVSCLLLA